VLNKRNKNYLSLTKNRLKFVSTNVELCSCTPGCICLSLFIKKSTTRLISENMQRNVTGEMQRPQPNSRLYSEICLRGVREIRGWDSRCRGYNGTSTE
jgi:hypothetical protein